MTRSQINSLMREASGFFARMSFRLPPWAAWGPGQWKGMGERAREIVENMLGWDLTDFGGGRFQQKGLLLFTIRNGNLKAGAGGKPYAEKIMIVGENQETPMHFHWKKMEDIINRGGGNLVIELHGSTPEEGLSREPIGVSIDGISHRLEAGARVVLTPGESICLLPRLYHRFHGQGGRVLVGEVSSVNDDTTDNRFYEPQGRFPEIEEDEEPLHLLVTDYPRYL